MRNIIGLTGQSGSGKSVAADILRKNGFLVLDCDKIAHENMMPKGKAYNEIVEYFGDIILENGEINRKILGNIVFNDGDKLKKLNEITHKYIVEIILNTIAKSNENIVIDAPLLFEAGLEKLCHKVWAVVCPEDVRIERIVKRDGISPEGALARFKNQKSIDFYIENADIIIENSGDIQLFEERVIYEINKIPI